MSEWWTYTPSDLLLFSPRVYYRLIELHNIAVWPVHIGAALLGLLLVRSPGRGRSARALGCDLGVGRVVHSLAPLRPDQLGGDLPRPGVRARRAALHLGRLRTGRFVVRPKRTPPSAAGLALLLMALIGYPLIAPAVGRHWRAAELFAVVPDPTAATTLAILALSSAKDRTLLMVIPCLWCFIAGATLWTMGSPDFVAAPLIALAAILVSVSGHREVFGHSGGL